MSNGIVKFADIEQYGPQKRLETFKLRADELDRDELEDLGEMTIDVVARDGELEKEYVVEGHASFTGDLRCSRCLEPYPFANRSSFTVRYRPRSEAPDAGEEEIEIGPEELEVEYYDEPLVSLRELAAEQVQLSLPMKPLCGEGCLGLCLRCGMNLNSGACECEVGDSDPRWAALRGLRDSLAKKNEV